MAGNNWFGVGAPAINQIGYGGGRQPYAGPNRTMDGDPAFEAWRQRQFSSQPFSGPNDPLFKMPTQPGQSQGTPFDRLKNEADPRDILNSPAFKRLMDLSSSTGATDAANKTMSPAIAELQKYLGQNDPLGVSQLAAITRQKGLSSLRDAGAGARRRAEESFGGLGSSSDPAELGFMKEMLRTQEAGGIGQVEQAASETDIGAKTATAQFRQGVANALAQIGLGQGQLSLGQSGAQAGAAQGALTAESFARNTWADVWSRLFQNTMPGNQQPKRPIKGYDQRGDPVYDENPFPGPQSFGSYLGGWNE